MLVAYISVLCGNRRHTASQYALLTSLAAAGRTLFAAASGFIVNAIGWPAFFVVSAAAALPSLLLLVSLQREGHFAEIDGGRPCARADAQRTP
jgi:PAT family beta-lactamase induction signal transducer AmpG